MEYRVDLEHLPPERSGRRPGPVDQFVSSAAKIAWERVVPEKVRTWLRDLEDTFRLAEGLVEPAAGRYQLSYPKGSLAKIYIDGKHFMGVSGELLQDSRQDDSAALHRDDPLEWLRLLQGVTEARYAGDETLRGTPCRKVGLSKIVLRMRPTSSQAAVSESASDDPAEFTVWIDEEHIRQVQTVVLYSDPDCTTKSRPSTASLSP